MYPLSFKEYYDLCSSIGSLTNATKVSDKEDDTMIGAILGDIIGSPYEFARGDKGS